MANDIIEIKYDKPEGARGEPGQFVIPIRTKDQYVNATAMCKAFGKLWGHYYRGKNLKFLESLAAVIQIRITDLVDVQQGGKPEEQGTYVHPDVASDLAHWLCPTFRAYVAGWVTKLRTTGIVSIQGATTQPVSISPEIDITDDDRNERLLEIMLAEHRKRRAIEAGVIALQASQKEVEVRLAQVSERAEAAVSQAKQAFEIMGCHDNYFTVRGFCSFHKQKCPDNIARYHGTMLGRRCRNALKPIPVGKALNTQYGSVNTYPEGLLREYFTAVWGFKPPVIGTVIDQATAKSQH